MPRAADEDENRSLPPASTPFGYTLEGRTLKIMEDRADVVRRIYAAYLSGRGMQDIADEMNCEGLPKRFGHDRWYTSTIFYILTNISYTGDMIWQKTFTTDSLPCRKIDISTASFKSSRAMRFSDDCTAPDTAAVIGTGKISTAVCADR